MPKSYYKKENLRNIVFCGKSPIVFQPTVGDTGVIEVDVDSAEDKVLADMAKNRIGGVIKISPEIFESLKKNELVRPSPPSSRPLHSQMRVSPAPDQVGIQKLAVPSVAAGNVAQNGQGAVRVMPADQPPSSLSAFRARYKTTPADAK